jgi:hypothetical protein
MDILKAQKKIEVCLLCIIIFELCLGGSGRSIALNDVLTLRMILFLLSLVYATLIFLSGKPFRKFIAAITIFFAFTVIFSTLVGFWNGSSAEYIFEDVKGLSYFPAILFFSCTIDNYKKILLVSNIVKISSVLLLIFELSILLAIQLGILNYSDFYLPLALSEQFVFRAEPLFVYKGFLYLCVGFFFFYLEKSFLSRSLSALLILGIYLTDTRGFLIFTILIPVLYSAFENISNKKFLRVFLFLLAVIGVAMKGVFSTLTTVMSKDESDFIRIQTFREFYERINNTSMFIGHGFGSGVPIRPMHMEISFLEIYHKQGIVGLLFWIVVLIYIVSKFLSIYKNHKLKTIALPLVLSSIFIYIQSFTNPFINNPIGMSFIIITCVSLDVLSQQNVKELSHSDSRVIVPVSAEYSLFSDTPNQSKV